MVRVDRLLWCGWTGCYGAGGPAVVVRVDRHFGSEHENKNGTASGNANIRHLQNYFSELNTINFAALFVDTRKQDHHLNKLKCYNTVPVSTN
jgi:hypothetical protein